MRILVVNWQDRENPQAGGAETHLHEVFGRLAARGHEVTLLCGGWPGAAPTAEWDGIQAHCVGTRYTFPLLVRQAYARGVAGLDHDVLVEDLNKLPLVTPWWGSGRTVVVGGVHDLFGATAFKAIAPSSAESGGLGERPVGHFYRNVPFQAVSVSTADDLVSRGVPRAQVQVIYQGVDTAGFTPDPTLRSPTPLFAYLGRLKRYKGVQARHWRIQPPPYSPRPGWRSPARATIALYWNGPGPFA